MEALQNIAGFLFLAIFCGFSAFGGLLFLYLLTGHR